MGNCFYNPNVQKPKKTTERAEKVIVNVDEVIPQLIDKEIKSKIHMDDSSQSPERTRSAEVTNYDPPVKRKENKKMQILAAESEGNEGVAENIKIVEKVMNAEDKEFVRSSLRSHFFFSAFQESELDGIMKGMFYCQVASQEFVFKQGDDANSFFIVDEGSFSVIIDDEIKAKTLAKGASFGELALLYSAKRSASIRATTNSFLWAIAQSTFKKLLMDMSRKTHEENRKFMDNIAFFNNMNEEQKTAIANVLITERYEPGHLIVNEGDSASSFYIIKEGVVSIIKGTNEIRKMHKGDSFGEQALYYNTKRSCSVKAETEVQCLSLGRDILVSVLGNQVQFITFKNMIKWAFERSELLSKLTKSQLERISDNVDFVKYKKGEQVQNLEKGVQGIIIVLEGAIRMVNSKRVIGKGLVFGEEFLLEKSKSLSEKADAIIMESDGVLGILAHAKVEKVLKGNLEQAILKNQQASMQGHSKKASKDGDKSPRSVSLQNLLYIKKLGSGQFGSVYLVKEKGGKELYAIKVISKEKIHKLHLEKHIEQEKQVLELMEFPLTLSFKKAFSDHSNIYFLTEYVRGIELFDAIRDIGLLSSYDSQFMVGCLILALEYIHGNDIIYRDVKPENIMIDDKGYVKLIDMGTAKKVSNLQGKRTFTIIGTPHYMAPEIISGKGYSFNCDIWSVGVCLFEFLCGEVPFAEDAEDPYEIYEEIMKKRVEYPSFLRDKKAKQLIDQMLSKMPEARLGGSYDALKVHPWLSSLDWEKLLQKKIKSPYIPPSEKWISQEEIVLRERKGRYLLQEIEGANS